MQLTILYVCCARTWRGGEQQLINLYWALNKRNHTQIIFCVKHSVVETYCIEHNIKHYTFIKLGGVNIAAAFKLKNICEKKEKIDILYLNDSDSHSMGYVASFLGLKTPAVVSRKKVLPIRDSLFSVKKYNATFIKRIICVSATVKEILSPKIKNTSRLVVVHEGIQPPDEASIMKYVLTPEIASKNFDYLVGCTAALTAEKDHFTFLKTAAILVKERKLNIGFIIAGEGNLKDEIINKIKEMGLTNHVFMLGFIKNIPSLLKTIDVLLFTSQSEAFSISILEAFFLHLPVISTKWRGVDEMIVHGETGLLSPLEDANSLAANTEYILKNESVKLNISQNAYRFVQQYNYDAMAVKIEEVFFNMLA